MQNKVPQGLQPRKGSWEAAQPIGGQIELTEVAQASNLRGHSVQEVLREVKALQGSQGPQCCGQLLQAVVCHSKEGECGQSPQGLRQL